MISEMSVAKQFMLLAALGVALTVAGVGLTLKRTYDVAFDAKRIEIQNEAEEGASIVRYFLQREQSGAMTKQEAQARAKEAVGAIRFQGVNYVALLGLMVCPSPTRIKISSERILSISRIQWAIPSRAHSLRLPPPGSRDLPNFIGRRSAKQSRS